MNLSFGQVAVVALALASPSLAVANSIDLSDLRSELAERFPETTARPLFSMDRSPPYVPPPPTPVVMAPAPPPPPPLPAFDEMTFVLTGVVQVGMRRMAILSHTMTGQAFTVEEGEIRLPGTLGDDVSVDIIAIEADAVTLQGEDFSIRLSIRAPFAPERNNFIPQAREAKPVGQQAG